MFASCSSCMYEVRVVVKHCLDEMVVIAFGSFEERLDLFVLFGFSFTFCRDRNSSFS